MLSGRSCSFYNVSMFLFLLSSASFLWTYPRVSLSMLYYVIFINVMLLQLTFRVVAGSLILVRFPHPLKVQWFMVSRSTLICITLCRFFCQFFIIIIGLYIASTLIQHGLMWSTQCTIPMSVRTGTSIIPNWRRKSFTD